MRLGSFLILATTFLLLGCGKEKTGSATLRFAQNRDLVSLADLLLPQPRATYAASTFKMMLIAAYLTEDIDPVTQNNLGKTTMIYLNPTCQDDIMHCDISAGTAEDGQPMSKVISNFFDFTSASQANTDLNAQARSVTVGSYKYARLEFCKYNSGNAQNIKWASTAAGVNSEQSFQRNSCTVNSAQFSPPVTISEGGTVTITLSYDISTTVEDGGAGSNCSAGKCFNLPTFVPSAS